MFADTSKQALNLLERYLPDGTRPETIVDRTVTIFLNRDCPRRCYQCGIADGSRRSMSAEDWIKALYLLHDVLGATFFLCLGVEPLLLKDGFVDIVQALTDRKLPAGWYTTSPEPMFTRFREKLLKAGIGSWSSGVDTLPHYPPMDYETDKKSREALIGLRWMAERGVPTHTTTTVHKKNLHLIPEMMEWINNELPNTEYGINFVHWRKGPGFDFFSPAGDMADMLWDGSDEERAEVKRVMDIVLTDSLKPGRKFHTDAEYVRRAHEFYDKIDMHCQGNIGPAVDADGTMRLCGYHTGEAVQEYNVLDLDKPGVADLFRAAWNKDLDTCSGCLWACYRVPDGVGHQVHAENVPPNRTNLLQIRAHR